MKLRTYLRPAALLLLLPLLSPATARAATAPTLGTAGAFAVLAGSTVTNTGPTTLIGDLGVSPGTAATGFPPGIVSGATHLNDAVALQAQTDATAAYNNAAGQPCDVTLTGQDLGGKTLTPGVYCFASSAQLTGQLILDDQGNPSSVFIFQIGSTLTTASTASVVVINGAQPCSSNIFWQVGSSATLGTNTSFTGNILALASITLNTGTVTNGGLYAQTGAVTLDSNNVVRNNGVCSTAPTSTPSAATATSTSTPSAAATATSTSTPSAAATATGTATPIAAATSTPTATDTALPASTPTATDTAPPASTATAPAAPPANTATPIDTAMATGTPIVAATPTSAATNTPANTATNTPTSTATPIAAAPATGASTTPTTLTRTTTSTVTVPTVPQIRYHDVTRVHTKITTLVRYHDVTRMHTKTTTLVRYRTVKRFTTSTRIKRLTTIRVVVKHKVVYTSKVRYVTVVHHITQVTIRHKTVVTTAVTYHYYHLPKTGRFAGPVATRHGAIPPVEARMSITRLGISWAPVWARDYRTNSDGSLNYDLVPAYGATRFASSAALGQAGLTLMSGHDDIAGNIFRYLGTMRRGDVIQTWRGAHTFRYVVTSVHVVTPDDVRLLSAAYTRPTLALISCTPYWVDTHRVVVIAQMQ